MKKTTIATTRKEIRARAAASAVEAVNDADLGHDDLRATLRNAHGSWSDAAAAAGCHDFDGIEDSDRARQLYYRAYEGAARAHVERLTA